MRHRERRNVYNIHSIGEFDQAQFYVIGARQLAGSRHHTFQPLQDLQRLTVRTRYWLALPDSRSVSST